MSIKTTYEQKYKTLLFIPLILLVLAFAQIGFQYATTGDFLHKGVSLKGGSTITFDYDSSIDLTELENTLSAQFPTQGVTVRTLSSAGQIKSIAIDSGVQTNSEIDLLLSALTDQVPLTEGEYSIEVIGSSLGESFFAQIIRALIAAFTLMGVAVFWIFTDSLKYKFLTLVVGFSAAMMILFSGSTLVTVAGYIISLLLIVYYGFKSIPSVTVIASAFSDIIITLAIFNLTEIKLSTAGIAAFLMIIGYSVDTDILLNTRLLKRKNGTEMERIYSSIKTGLTMSGTTLIALLVSIIFVQSEVVKQIMIILFIGLIVDVIITYLFNVGILRYYLERKRQ